jgi:hypothetical protein
MAVTLNRQALKYARKLVKAGKVVHDERDDWSEHQLPAAEETAWVKSHGWNDYAKWHLGVDKEKTPETKGRFSFPIGDYRNVHRCAVISAESRAAQFGHADIAEGAKSLLTLIDKRAEKAATRASKQKPAKRKKSTKGKKSRAGKKK